MKPASAWPARRPAPWPMVMTLAMMLRSLTPYLVVAVVAVVAGGRGGESWRWGAASDDAV
jgi:hypothetical protein